VTSHVLYPSFTRHRRYPRCVLLPLCFLGWLLRHIVDADCSSQSLCLRRVWHGRQLVLCIAGCGGSLAETEIQGRQRYEAAGRVHTGERRCALSRCTKRRLRRADWKEFTDTWRAGYVSGTYVSTHPSHVACSHADPSPAPPLLPVLLAPRMLMSCIVKYADVCVHALLDLISPQILDEMLASPRWAHLAPGLSNADRERMVHMWHELDGKSGAAGCPSVFDQESQPGPTRLLDCTRSSRESSSQPSRTVPCAC
jgi:hypothetical protein